MLDMIGLIETSATDCEEAEDSHERHSDYDFNGSEKREEEASAHRLRQSIGTIFEKRHGYADLPWNWLNPSGSGLSTGRKAVLL